MANEIVHDLVVPIKKYEDALTRVDDLALFVELANDLDYLSKSGRINDMRRLLVIKFDKYVETLAPLIQHTVDKAVIEARINEISNVYNNCSLISTLSSYANDEPMTIRDRIKELKSLSGSK